MKSHHESVRREIDADLLKIVKQGPVLFVLQLGDKPLLTPGGNLVAYPNRRLLQQIVRELKVQPLLDDASLSTYSIFSIQRDCIEGGKDAVSEHLREVLQNDPLLLPICMGKSPEWTDELSRYQSPMKFLQDYRQPLPAVSDSKQLPEDFIDLFRRSYASLSTAQRAVITALWQYHHSGLFMPLLLVLGRCTISEYEHAVDAQFRHLFTLDHELFDRRVSKSGLRFGAIIADQYLTYVENFPMLELLKAGESMNREFKSSMCWNLKTKKKDPEIEHAWLKTVAAFLNTDGGMLLIGVADNGEPLGIDLGGFENFDKYQLHFWNRIKDCMTTEVGHLVTGRPERVKDKVVFVVECLRSPEPVFLRFKGTDEEFCVRTGPRTIRLGIREAVRWIADRFTLQK